MRPVPHVPHVPIFGQQQQVARAGIAQAVQQLSLSIYGRAASEYVCDTLHSPDRDREELRQMARAAHTAAQAYFEGLSICEFEAEEKPK